MLIVCNGSAELSTKSLQRTARVEGLVKAALVSQIRNTGRTWPLYGAIRNSTDGVLKTDFRVPLLQEKLKANELVHEDSSPPWGQVFLQSLQSKGQ